jgi:2-polyprenyl-3-methyl-5-hydroxy-6-metoxy-1,4-benzoquinol methylase
MMNDYHNKFSPSIYLETGYKHPGENRLHHFPTQCLHAFFKDVRVPQTSEYRVLDFGCGPVVAYVISAARVATEVIFAEYTEKNRKAVQQWLDKEPTSWNWRPFFEHVVVILEEKRPREAIEREERLRSITRAVVPCDITQDPPIAEGYGGLYDVVMCMLSIEAGCHTHDEYKVSVKRVYQLIKSGGCLLLYSTVRRDTSTLGSYNVGNETFTEIPLSLEFVYAALKDANFLVVKTAEKAAFIVAKKP